ncbi:MAG: sigma-54-dependent Fis family transcriptional regulator [Rhizobiales bacterium]|nr:sigma-54-dependent Fis family transcriptional regulator [Hyphomicrobiales bacterium]
MASTIILIDDDEEVLEALSETLRLGGYGVEPCSSLMAARDHLAREADIVVLSDVRMPARDGFAVLKEVKSVDVDIPVILISGHADVTMAVEAMRRGAHDFIEKPADPAYVLEILHRASAHRRLVLDHRRLAGNVSARAIEHRILGSSHPMKRLRELVLALAEVDSTVLIQGETGTGKELVARSLHDFGPRNRGPFIAINCAALPATLIESELFGHEPGAFIGAKERRIGKIEQAHRGTLFLDEIESMPLEAQTRLLRVLQERRVERLGGVKEIPVDIRVIAATKADLSAIAKSGQFREDLVYRLAVLPLETPPLRQRGADDILLLFRHFVSEVAARMKRPMPPEIDPTPLLSHDWPGNIRELRNAAERAAMGFPPLGSGPMVSAITISAGTLETRMAAHEKRELTHALAEGGTFEAIAERLGVSRKTLYLKLRTHGLSRGADFDS